jgi:hypothetical protein
MKWEREGKGGKKKKKKQRGKTGHESEMEKLIMFR